MRLLLAVGCVLSLAALVAADVPADLPEVFRDDCGQGADHWQPTDPKAWKLLKTDRGQVYCQFQESKYEPPFRSPFNYALLKDVVVGDFVLNAKVQSTCKDYPHRDMVVVFGYQNPTH